MQNQQKNLFNKNTIFENKLDQIIEYNKRQDKSIAEIHKIVTGNGTPENGLVVKQARMSEKITAICATLKIHWAFLISISLTTIGAIIKVAFF